MTPGKFWDSYKEAIELLKIVGIFKEGIPHQNRPYSSECKEYSKSRDYSFVYKSIGDYGDYDIILSDNSYFQINTEPYENRLLFIQCPTQYVSFEDFFKIKNYNLDGIDPSYFREELDFEYDQFLAEQSINSGATYIRYDIDPIGRQDNENIHAYAHLHIGFSNNIRIPVGLRLTPLVFVMFIIRHVYYDNWIDAIKNNKINKYLDAKKQCEMISEELWSDLEKTALYLS